MLRVHPFPPFSSPFLVLLLLSLLNSLPCLVPSETASNGSNYQRCKDAYVFRCGTKNHDIRYPFTVPDMPEGCGLPLYPLKCSGEDDDTKNLTIAMRGEDFRVVAINYAAGILTVADQDIQVDPKACNVTYEDSTVIDTDLFELTPLDLELTLYRCPNPLSSPPLFDPNFLKLNCPFSNAPLWYLGLGTIEDRIAATLLQCNNATVLIKPPPLNENLSTPNSLQDTLQQGFDIKWKAGGTWCPQCLQSGGTCGYISSDSSSEDACYCSNGNRGVGACKKTEGSR